MHRGSSKVARGEPPATDNLPLSAPSIVVEVEVARAGHTRTELIPLGSGALVRDAVRAVGLAPEGASVLIEGLSVPLDQPLEPGTKLVVVPTFSGG